MNSKSIDTLAATAARPKRLAGLMLSLVCAFALPTAWIALRSAPEAASSAEMKDDLPGRASYEAGDTRERPVSPDGIELASHESFAVEPSTRLDDDSLSADEKMRQQVVGEWEDDYQGHRHLTIRSDGTATMVVKPSGLGSVLFAERLRFDIEWTSIRSIARMLPRWG